MFGSAAPGLTRAIDAALIPERRNVSVYSELGILLNENRPFESVRVWMPMSTMLAITLGSGAPDASTTCPEILALCCENAADDETATAITATRDFIRIDENPSDAVSGLEKTTQ